MSASGPSGPLVHVSFENNCTLHDVTGDIAAYN